MINYHGCAFASSAKPSKLTYCDGYERFPIKLADDFERTPQPIQIWIADNENTYERNGCEASININ